MANKTIDKHILALWNQIITQIQPKEVRSGLQIYCQLVEFDLTNQTATIYVQSLPVAKIIADKIQSLESAFEQVLLVPIKVQLQVPEVEADIEPNPDTQTIEYSTLDNSIGNQGLGAPLQWSGLNFRSKSEIKIAQALDDRGVLYFPNARGRLSQNYSRVNREADFLVCDKGRWGILECDGEQYHQSAADDHARDLLWNAQGIWFIKRFSSTECYNNPAKVVDLFLAMLKAFDSQHGKGNP
jgi:hypothetical protein